MAALAVGASALAGGGVDSHTGHAGAGQVSRSDLWTLWAVPPVEVAAIAAVAVVVALRVRGSWEVGHERRSWTFLVLGVGVLALSVCSPLGGLAQGGLLAAHILQHTLIGALAPLLLLLALPRPPCQVDGCRRAAARLFGNPLVTFPLWALSTLVWLLPGVHREVLDHRWLWVLQQMSSFVVGVALWAPIVERAPTAAWFRSRWKVVYMLGVWGVGLLIANVYWFSGTAFYGYHAGAARRWAVSPLEDQANAGTVMALSHCLLAFGAIAVLFFRQAQEDGLRQRLIEAGVDPVTVGQAMREDGARDLARRAGVSARERPGID